jgi:hypothetical protein
MRNLHPPQVPNSVEFTDLWANYVYHNEHYIDEATASPQIRAVLALQKLISYYMEWKMISKSDAIKLIAFYRREYGYSPSPRQDEVPSNEASPIGKSYMLKTT